MSRFYGSMNGAARTTATRTGSTRSGMSAHIRGCDIGARVAIGADGEDDTVAIYATRGSSNPITSHLGTLRRREDGRIDFILNPALAARHGRDAV